jgi:hypothetical protein
MSVNPHLDFFKAQFEQFVALKALDQIMSAVGEFLAVRMPGEELVRRGLLDWAKADLAEQQALIASGKILPLATLSNAICRIAMLRSVTREIEAYERIKRL